MFCQAFKFTNRRGWERLSGDPLFDEDRSLDWYALLKKNGYDTSPCSVKGIEGDFRMTIYKGQNDSFLVVIQDAMNRRWMILADSFPDLMGVMKAGLHHLIGTFGVEKQDGKSTCDPHAAWPVSVVN